VVQVDIDPVKRDLPIWGFPVDLAIHSDSAAACAALASEVERQLRSEDRARLDARRQVLAARHRTQQAARRERALLLSAHRPIAPEWAAHCLNEIMDEETLVIGEAVTNSAALWNYLALDRPGTYFESLGSSLGWGLGAALGAKLAAPSKTVVCVVGDGAWMFGSPIAAYWAAQQRHCPFLTVVFNNQEYSATTEAILALAPEGYARRSGNYPACDLPQPPLYSRLAEAMGLWARTVDHPAQLLQVLREAIAEVRGGRSALVDICVSSARPAEELLEE
jgi:acetolactate synthase-1/2/3 large subunit